ncbi:MAG: AbrB/MazE/SpoVT family DNA-binding domain-containing protein [Chloroflexota bacterium]|nr:AbrB/MazE/SpoVT family DNA-binding domain-containing protein [Chloroflexota bacterium]
MLENVLEEGTPKFYGVATVGERGQIVIPAEARRDLEVTPATKLLVFGGQGRRMLLLTKEHFVTEFLASAMTLLSQYEQMLKSTHEASVEGHHLLDNKVQV